MIRSTYLRGWQLTAIIILLMAMATSYIWWALNAPASSSTMWIAVVGFSALYVSLVVSWGLFLELELDARGMEPIISERASCCSF